MKVKLAQSAGFCMGVRRAVDIVLKVANPEKTIYTLGPLIHNPQTLQMLATKNVRVVDTVSEDLKGKTVVIRAHGIPPEKRKRLKEAGAGVCDATCPNVARSQGLIKKFHREGYTIVIVGDRGHAEIESLKGFCGDSYHVIESIEEAKVLPEMNRVCVIAQTTLDGKEFQEIAQEVKRHARECNVFNTVCGSTVRRQKDVRMLADMTDATVVVGGNSSANTRRLANISRDLGQPTFLVESEEDLDMEALSQYDIIGVTAGASTPNWVIKKVVDHINSYGLKRRKLTDFLHALFAFIINSNLFLSFTAAFLTYGICHLNKIPPYPKTILLPFFALFSMHVFNRFLDLEWDLFNAPYRTSFYHRMKPLLLVSAGASALVSLIISWDMGLSVFTLMCIAIILGILYSKAFIPKSLGVRYGSLKNIPGSKDIVIAGAWTFLTVIIPFLASGIPFNPSVAVTALFVFILVFCRSGFFSIESMQGDQIVGRETIPVVIGRNLTLRILYVSLMFLIILLIVSTILGYIPHYGYLLVIPAFYTMFYLTTLTRRLLPSTTVYEAVIDFKFILTGILAYLATR